LGLPARAFGMIINKFFFSQVEDYSESIHTVSIGERNDNLCKWSWSRSLANRSYRCLFKFKCNQWTVSPPIFCYLVSPRSLFWNLGNSTSASFIIQMLLATTCIISGLHYWSLVFCTIVFH
jgi:hypothetical protein